MSILNGNSPPGRTVYVLLADSVQGDRRKMLETGLSLMPGLQRVQRHIEGVDHVRFRTTPELAQILLASVPDTMKGILITRLEPSTKYDLCPATL